MERFAEEFMMMLEAEDKDTCVKMALSRLSEGLIDIPALYEEVLRPALNNIGCSLKDKNLCIWKEHVRTSIVRTIIECCYPYIIKEKEQNDKGNSGGKVLVICPDGEMHEVGARMASDYFTLCGYDTVFVGSSTPREEFLSAIDVVAPKYVAISVTNYYNLVAAKRTIQDIREKSNKKLVVVAGGNAFVHNPGAAADIGADLLVNTLEDIRKLAGRDDK